MDGKKIKWIILFILGIIALLIVLVIHLFMTRDIFRKEEEQAIIEQQEEEKRQQELRKDILIGIWDTKLYEKLIKKIDAKNIALNIEVEYEGKLQIESKDDNLYVSTGTVDIISKDNTVYIVEHPKQIVSVKENSKIEIRDLLTIPEIKDYNTVEYKVSNETVTETKEVPSEEDENEVIEVTEKFECYCETIGNLRYYFKDDALRYIEIVNDEKKYDIEVIGEVTNPDIFNIPEDYSLIDGNLIDLDKVFDKI